MQIDTVRIHHRYAAAAAVGCEAIKTATVPRFCCKITEKKRELEIVCMCAWNSKCAIKASEIDMYVKNVRTIHATVKIMSSC